MVEIKELNPRTCNCCNSCLSGTLSNPKEIDEIMGHKVAEKLFKVSVGYGNSTSSVILCDACLKDLCNKLDSVMIIEKCKSWH